MSQVPRVSLLIPVRNAVACIPGLLHSISAQTLKNFEVVWVDDGSEDGTAELLLRAGRLDGRLRTVRQGPAGIAVALEVGCQQCQGEFVARMDADDAMHPERLRLQEEYLSTHPRVGLVSCRVRHGGDRATQAGYARHVAWVNCLMTHEEMALRRFVESPVAHPSVMFRRRLLEDLGGYREGGFPEDYELWLRWLAAGVRFAKLPEELLVWNDSPGRLSRTDPRYRAEAFYEVKCRYLAEWLRGVVATDRTILLWGAGRVTRQRFRGLEKAGICIQGYVDVDWKKQGITRDGRRVWGPEEFPGDAFVIAGVSAWGARELTGRRLEARGLREGEDFILAA